MRLNQNKAQCVHVTHCGTERRWTVSGVDHRQHLLADALVVELGLFVGLHGG